MGKLISPSLIVDLVRAYVMYIIVMISFVVHNNGSVDSMQAEKNLMEISKFDKNKTTFLLSNKNKTTYD